MDARIVLVEDEADIRRLIAITLRKRGHTVVETATGEAALPLIQTLHPDLVILDVMLPGMSGLAVAKYLATDPQTSTIPLLILSALGQTAEVAAGLGSGARAYLVKPFSPATLLALVGELASLPIARE